MELAALVDPRDRAAAIADLDDLEHRRVDRIAGVRRGMLDLILGRYLGGVVLDQCAFRRRAADVEREDIRLTDGVTQRDRAQHAAGRTGLDHRNRIWRAALVVAMPPLDCMM
jgi:hypothetical protein